MKLLLWVGFCMVLGLQAQAQQPGKVEVKKDPLIDLLQQRRIIYDHQGEASAAGEKKGIKTTAPGFRVQIYSGADRSQAYAEQARFKRIFTDIDTYVSYEEPNYRVKVGDFTNRGDAQELMRELKKKFSSVFLFTETVNVEY